MKRAASQRPRCINRATPLWIKQSARDFGVPAFFVGERSDLLVPLDELAREPLNAFCIKGLFQKFCDGKNLGRCGVCVYVTTIRTTSGTSGNERGRPSACLFVFLIHTSKGYGCRGEHSIDRRRRPEDKTYLSRYARANGFVTSIEDL